MKLYNKIGLFALSVVGMSSCAINDPFNDKMEIGQELPTVSWELGSAVCKAGEDMNFKGKFYASPNNEIDHAEVWAAVTRTEVASATCKLTSTLAYTKTVSISDTVRRSQFVSKYSLEQAEWVNHEYILNASFPTSRTLSTVSWVNPVEWDQEKFDGYYPTTFQSEFVETIVNYLTKDSTYYTDLRHVYVNFDFKAEQFEALNAKYNVNFPTEVETGIKSDLWFSNTEKVVWQYYITIDAKGNKVINEVKDPSEAPDDAVLYDVYDSSFWVLCRYSDDIGAPVTQVRAEYIPYLKDLVSQIKFTEWIYNNSDQWYTVTFSRSYNLIPTFRVYDKKGKIGTDTDAKEIELN